MPSHYGMHGAGDLIGDGYVTDVRKRLNAYRKRLRPRGGESAEDLAGAIEALTGEPAPGGMSKTALKRMLNTTIMFTFTPGGTPLSKMKKRDLMALASKLQEYSRGGRVRDFSESDSRFVVDSDFPDPGARAPRKDKGVPRGPFPEGHPRRARKAPGMRAAKRPLSAYNKFYQENYNRSLSFRENAKAISQKWRAQKGSGMYRPGQRGSGHQQGHGMRQTLARNLPGRVKRMVPREVLDYAMSGDGHNFMD